MFNHQWNYSDFKKSSSWCSSQETCHKNLFHTFFMKWNQSIAEPPQPINATKQGFFKRNRMDSLKWPHNTNNPTHPSLVEKCIPPSISSPSPRNIKEPLFFGGITNGSTVGVREVGGGETRYRTARWLSFMPPAVINGTIRERQYLVAIYYLGMGLLIAKNCPSHHFRNIF